MSSGGELPAHELLKACSTRLYLPKEQTIHVPGARDSNLYYIEEGTVRFSLNSYDGDEEILYILGPGNFFNEGSLYCPQEVMCHIYCEEASVILKADSSVFKNLMKNTGFVETVFRGMMCKNGLLEQEISNISFKSCKERLLLIFIKECCKEKIYDHDWYDVKKRYTHQDLASIIGANRVTVSKMIGELCEENQIRCLNRRIQVNRKALKRRE